MEKENFISEWKNNKVVLDFIEVWNDLEKKNLIIEVEVNDKVYCNLVMTDYIKDLDFYNTPILCDYDNNEVTIKELLDAVVNNKVKVYKKVLV